MCLDEVSMKNLTELRNDLCEMEGGSPESFETNGAETEKKTQTQPNGIVSVVAYLCGIPRERFGKEYSETEFERLEGDTRARIIRSLTAIRTALMLKPGLISHKMQNEMKNLDTMPDLIDPAYFKPLNEAGIRIISGSKLKSVTEYIVLINNEISNRIRNIKDLIPTILPFEYLKNTIVMPNGSKGKEVQAAIDRFRETSGSYPFRCWINWRLETRFYHERPELNADACPAGNILLNDRKFLTLVYRINGSEFTDYDRVTAADAETCERLDAFMRENTGAVLLVDCENADPYKLCATLSHMQDNGMLRNGALKKIVLFDDYHTVDTWDILETFVGVRVEHEEIERVTGRKSLVDIALTAGACREHFVNGTDAFLIASSDSDFWGMMRAMPDVRFLVLAERDAIGKETVRLYEDRGIAVCYTDEFSQNLGGFRDKALRHVFEKQLNNAIVVNLRDLFEGAFEAARLKESAPVRDEMFANFVKGLRPEIDGEGNLSIRFA
ncbi:MAG: hypothetical protein Q4C53_02205 [Clostridia bacterium]|nr:hypothetical protein [Clostridia bacterium]